ncbi:sugar isomerase domain-containing protein [Vibrio artabrorum]|uniref:sugar isomerase domain-containing protein n=1 Tax=Vibrio artabrorum TaxID=446374 RepID=UPI0035523847
MYKEYLNGLLHHLDIASNQQDAISKGAQLMADTIENNGLIHVTGCGHSQMFAHEMWFRAGGLVQINAILPPTLALYPYAPMSTFSERQHGLASIALNAEKDIRSGDVLIVVSTSGRNAVPIEFAIEAKKRGLKVIGLTSMAFTEAVSSRHDSGNKLCDVCDVVLDMGGVAGDATIEVPNHDFSTGSISSVIGFTLLNTMTGECIKELVTRGVSPNIWRSVNSENAEQINRDNLWNYKDRITCL